MGLHRFYNINIILKNSKAYSQNFTDIGFRLLIKVEDLECNSHCKSMKMYSSMNHSCIFPTMCIYTPQLGFLEP